MVSGLESVGSMATPSQSATATISYLTGENMELELDKLGPPEISRVPPKIFIDTFSPDTKAIVKGRVRVSFVFSSKPRA